MATKINIQPTPDAERVVKLVEFAWKALDYLESVNTMFDTLMANETIEEKGPDGDLVEQLVVAGRICFPKPNKEIAQ